MSGPRKGHGTFACWRRGCNRPECAQAAYRYKKLADIDRARGVRRLVPAQPARAHLNALVSAGMAPTTIAAAAGLPQATVNAIIHGRRATIRRATDEAVRTVQSPLDIVSHGNGWVLRVGARRRVQALLRMGWAHADMRRHSGVNTAKLLSHRGGWVTVSTHTKVAAMYDQLWSTPGPSTVARERATARGYPSALAWDDDTIDDPNATPNLDGSPDLDWPEAAA